MAIHALPMASGGVDSWWLVVITSQGLYTRMEKHH